MQCSNKPLFVVHQSLVSLKLKWTGKVWCIFQFSERMKHLLRFVSWFAEKISWISDFTSLYLPHFNHSLYRWLIWLWWDHFHSTHSCLEYSLVSGRQFLLVSFSILGNIRIHVPWDFFETNNLSLCFVYSLPPYSSEQRKQGIQGIYFWTKFRW